ncbi:hypothetical protein Dimus_019008 [Dionaea muscipula]
MGKKASRDWTQIYAIYGMDEWETLIFLLIHATVFTLLSCIFFFYFSPICIFLQSSLALSSSSSSNARFAAGLIGSVAALSAVCLFFAAGNFIYSSISLRWEMSQRMLTAVSDWSNVRTALDVGCGSGMLLNAVALQLKKEGSSGRVVGLDQKKAITTLPTLLRTAGMEGVQEYVTCREGDVRRLPFSDDYFDVVVSGGYLHRVGKELGKRTAAAAAERVRVLGEVVRVLKPGGVGVVWDLVHVPEYVKKLEELRMEDISVSERVTAYLTSSHIVSFRKPRQHVMGPANEVQVRLDWR